MTKRQIVPWHRSTHLVSLTNESSTLIWLKCFRLSISMSSLCKAAVEATTNASCGDVSNTDLDSCLQEANFGSQLPSEIAAVSRENREEVVRSRSRSRSRASDEKLLLMAGSGDPIPITLSGLNEPSWPPISLLQTQSRKLSLWFSYPTHCLKSTILFCCARAFTSY